MHLSERAAAAPAALKFAKPALAALTVLAALGSKVGGGRFTKLAG